MIALKRIYKSYKKTDGFRILVDRLWPRGISKNKVHIDLWLKELGPSTELRTWFNHDKAKWSEFKRKYEKELKQKRGSIYIIKVLHTKHKNITLLYGAKDENHNQAIVIKEILEKLKVPKKNLSTQNKYFEEITKLLARTHPKLATTHRLEFKNVFGAVSGYVNGRIFISCGNFGIALRLPSKTLEGLFNKKVAKHLRFFPKGHIKREYAIFPKQIVNDDHRLRTFVDESVQYALKINV